MVRTNGGKKLIICFDGTGNAPSNALHGKENDTGITNVLMLHLLAGGSIDNTAQHIQGQRSLYYTGVGTRAGEFVNSLRFALALRGPTIVMNECRRDLKKHYNNGDQLYIFGFSRGAATARLFASELAKSGFDGNDGHVDGKDVSITFLGVWDTVADFMVPNLDGTQLPSCSHLKEHGVVSPAVRRVLHLMSLDYGRISFFPTPVGDVDDNLRREIWFPGTHCGVGGGWYERGLSDGACRFMLRAVSEDLPQDECLEFLYPGSVEEESRYDGAINYMIKSRIMVDKADFLGMIHEVHDPLDSIPCL